MIYLLIMAKFDFTKLNNSEYAFFLRKVQKLAEMAGAESLGLTSAFLLELLDNIDRITAILSSSHASEQTAVLHELDAKRDALLVYLFTTIRSGCKLPIAAQNTAAQSLSLIIKPYRGSQKLPHNQETQQIFSLQKDLEEASAAAHIATLGLVQVLAELGKVNDEYNKQSEVRSAKMAEKDLGNCHDVRLLTDDQYTYLTTIAGATALVIPSDEATKFVESMNILIKETKTAYNQRSAQHKSHASDKEVTTENETVEEA